MLVSVVIPLWNKVAHIERTLRSALGQSHYDLEIIVVNDGSTDESLAVVQSIRDRRIKIISQDNAGPGIARNAGMKHAAGEFIAFLDADDEWRPEFIKTSLALLLQHQDCATVAVGWSTDGTWSYDRQRWRDHGVKSGMVRVLPDWDVERLAWHVSYMHSSSTLSRKQFLLDVGGFCPYKGELYGEDRYLWINVLLRHPIYIEDECYVLFDRTASSLSCEDIVKPALAYLSHAREMIDRCPAGYDGLLRRFFHREYRASVKNWARQGCVARSGRLYSSLRKDHVMSRGAGILALVLNIIAGLLFRHIRNMKRGLQRWYGLVR